MERKDVGKRIAKLREAKNITANKLCTDIGQSRSYISHVEKGDFLPSLDTLFNICDSFGIKIDDFFNDKTEYPLQYQELIKELNKLDSQELAKVIDFVKLITIHKK